MSLEPPGNGEPLSSPDREFVFHIIGDAETDNPRAAEKWARLHADVTDEKTELRQWHLRELYAILANAQAEQRGSETADRIKNIKEIVLVWLAYAPE